MRPLGTEPVTSPELGAEGAAIRLEKGLSVKRSMSVLQPAAPVASKATKAARASRRGHVSAGERMTGLTRTQLDHERVNQDYVNKLLIRSGLYAGR